MDALKTYKYISAIFIESALLLSLLGIGFPITFAKNLFEGPSFDFYGRFAAYALFYCDQNRYHRPLCSNLSSSESLAEILDRRYNDIDKSNLLQIESWISIGLLGDRTWKKTQVGYINNASRYRDYFRGDFQSTSG